MTNVAGIDTATNDPWPWSPPPDSDSVTLLLAGDINIQYRDNPAEALENVRATLQQADLVYGNLEGLLVESQGPHRDIPDKGGWQHVGPRAVEALTSSNIAVVGLANNVAFGPANILATIAVLDTHGIAHTGAGPNIEAAHEPAVVERKAVRFGFLQYTAKWYAQDQQIATADRAGVARILSRDGSSIDEADLARLLDDVRRLRPLVDILVVSTHNRDGAGRPSAPELLAETRPLSGGPAADDPSLVAPIPLGMRGTQAEDYECVLAHAAIDAGADIVYGHGSHVLQGVEVYKGRPVMYCLGNFAMDWIRMRPNRDGMLARLVVNDKRVHRVSLVPLTRDDVNNNVLLLDPSTGRGRELIEQVESLSGGRALPIEGHEAVLVVTQPVATA